MNLIDTWLSLPLPALWLCLAGFYSASAIILIYLSFGRLVPPYFAGMVVIFGILVGFLANDPKNGSWRWMVG